LSYSETIFHFELIADQFAEQPFDPHTAGVRAVIELEGGGWHVNTMPPKTLNDR
jgi:hypothetical protein